MLRTQGDKVLDTPLPLLGGKGLFTAELEAALRTGAIDLAVHSLKDLPTARRRGWWWGPFPPRADVRDVLVSRSGCGLAELPEGATVGTSSRRRAAQIRVRYPHLQMLDIRGNVDTRVRKVLDPEGPYDATSWPTPGSSAWGVRRSSVRSCRLELMLPAPGQGALAVQCRDEPRCWRGWHLWTSAARVPRSQPSVRFWKDWAAAVPCPWRRTLSVARAGCGAAGAWRPWTGRAWSRSRWRVWPRCAGTGH